ncbi:hypothetical protein KW410_07840 [Vibrio fluvialis]|nr:hypothetical protein [Vibrio fluvialis]
MKSFVRDFLVPNLINLIMRSSTILSKTLITSISAIDTAIKRYEKSGLPNKLYTTGVVFFVTCIFIVPRVSDKALLLSVALFASAFAIRLFQFFQKTRSKKILGVSIIAIVQVFLIPLSISSASATIDRLIGLETSDFPITVALASNIYYVYNLMFLLVIISLSTSAFNFFRFAICIFTKKNPKGMYFMDYIGAVGFACYILFGLGMWNNYEKYLETPIKYISINTDFSSLSKYPVELKGTKKIIHKNGYYTYYDEIDNANLLWSSSYWRSIEETKFRTELIPIQEVPR